MPVENCLKVNKLGICNTSPFLSSDYNTGSSSERELDLVCVDNLEELVLFFPSLPE